MPELLYIPLDQIRVNPVALRDVDRTSGEFQELTNAIRSEGVMSPISVKRKPGEDGKQFELVDGLQRFSASQEVGTGTLDKVAGENGSQWVGRFTESQNAEGQPIKVGVIPAQIIDRDEAETIVSQIVANAHRIETKPIEYAKAIFKYLGYNPTMTEAEVAAKLNKNPAWLSKQLGLLKLDDSLKPLVNEGKIVLANAYVLAKMPKDEQLNWSERAQTLDSNKFAAAALQRIKEIRDAHRKGKEAGEEQFVPVAHLRKKPEIEAEVTKPEMGPALIRDLGVTAEIKPSREGLIQAAAAGFQLALQWATQMDPKSVELAKQKYEQRKESDKQAKIRRDAEKLAKKDQDLQKKAAEARTAAEAARAAAAALPPEQAADTTGEALPAGV